MTLEEKRERNEIMKKRHAEGVSLLDLMREYGFRSILTVEKIIDGRIVSSNKKPQQHASIVADVQIGMDIDHVAIKHNCHPALVKKVIKKAGIKSKEQIFFEHRNEEIIKSVKQGATLRETAKKFNLSVESIRLICLDGGVTSNYDSRKLGKLYESLLPSYLIALNESEEKVDEVLAGINKKKFESWVLRIKKIKTSILKRERDEQKILTLYKQCVSVTDIMKELKCSRAKIYLILHKNGIRVRELNIEERNEKIRHMYATEIGITTSEIGEIFNMTASNVCHILNNKHIPYSHEDYIKNKEKRKKYHIAPKE